MKRVCMGLFLVSPFCSIDQLCGCFCARTVYFVYCRFIYSLCGSLSILWHCLSLGLERKLTFSSPVATAEFSKFAGRDWGQEEKGTTEDEMAAPTRWTLVWVNSGSWWWTGRPGVLQFMGSQRVGHDWATELNWTELNWIDTHLGLSRWCQW